MYLSEHSFFTKIRMTNQATCSIPAVALRNSYRLFWV